MDQRARALKHYLSSNWAEACAGYELHLTHQPADVESRFRLADVYGHLNDFAAAESHLRIILDLRNDIPEVFFMLGMALQQQRLYEQSIEAFNCAIALRRGYTDAFAQRGLSYFGLGKLAESESDLREVLGQVPGHAVTYRYLPSVLKYQGKLDEAEAFYRAWIARNPRDPVSYSNLALMLAGQCRIEEAIEACRHALKLDSDDTGAHSNSCFATNYLASGDPAAIKRVHERAGQAYARRAPLVTTPLRAEVPNEGSRLKVGYVSADFRLHAVAFFVEPLLVHHDKLAFDITCYSTTTRPDEVTERLKRSATHWLDAGLMSDASLAARIRADGVNILVDLSGHTGESRLGVFAARAAPVQVTYLGYPNTTGLRAMDYRITDDIADPPGADSRYTEKLMRLPGGFLCYQPYPESPPAGRDPGGPLTFGSFNHQPKINPEVIRTWAAILDAVPGSRLILKNSAVAHGTIAQRCRDSFARENVDPNRVELLKSRPLYVDHLATYREIDIALDTFPYNGTTTTCDALWMGVPVVTLAGNLHAGRVGQSILARLGLDEWIAGDRDAYIRKVVELANDETRRIQYRESLRDRMQRSSLCDGARVAREVEAVYRRMWEEYLIQPGKGAGSSVRMSGET
jgi:predicted O-linked N-acetylglucosamine transferase (SPINDLY family)